MNTWILALLPCTLLAAQWEALGPHGGSMHLIAVDPRDPAVVIAGSRTGSAFRSIDAALSWTPLPLPRFAGVTLHALVINPGDSRVYFAGLNDPAGRHGGLWRSPDQGLHWEPVSDLAGRNILSMAVGPKPGLALAAGTDRGVFLSEDQGQSWRQISPPGHPEMNGIVSLAFDPREPGTLFAGTTHLPWKTTDLGQTWTSIHEGMIDDSDVFSILADRTQAGRVYASACSGIYSSADNGLNWTRAKGIPSDNRRTYIITQDRDYPNLLYAGTSAGLWKSADAGLSWKKLHPWPVNWLAVDPKDGRVMYAATDGGGILKSMDAGFSFRPRNRGLVNRQVSALLPAAQGLYAATMYEGEYGGLFFSDDRGRNWSLVANQFQLKGENIRRLTQGAAGRIVARTYNGALESADGGKSWVRMAAGRSVPAEADAVKIAGANVFEAAAHPKDGRIRLAAAHEGLLRSTDGGKSWKPVTAGLPAGYVRAVAFHPVRLGEALLLKNNELYRSTDAGLTWIRVAEGAPGAALNELVLSRHEPGAVYALSSDRGLFRLQIMP